MKPERFTAGVFVILVMGFMLLAPVSLVVKQSEKLFADKVKIINIDWEKIYPFAEKLPDMQEEKESLFEYIKRKIDEYTSQYLLGYSKIVEAAKTYEKIAVWNMVSVFDYNPIVPLKDGYLTSYTMSLDVAPDAEIVKDFADFCAEKGIPFIYINLPTKICISEDSDISGVLDFANQNTDRFLTMLRESGIKCYDFRTRLHESGRGHHASFFRTDHHWRPETGLWAAGNILEILRDDLVWDVEPKIIAPENFRYEIYRNWFLGSQGKKVTLARTTPDDFTMIYPKFETELRFELPDLELNLSGDFRVIYNMKEVDLIDYYGKDPYTAYMYADRPLSRLKNELAVNGKKLLIVKDSFGLCTVPFVALGVEYIDVLDVRHFTGSIRNFVDTERPDAVIVMYYSTVPGRALKPSATDEEKKFYNLH